MNSVFAPARKLRAVLALTVGISLLMAWTAAAASGPPTKKIYDCYTYSGGALGLHYVQALQLKTTTAYLVAPSRSGNHLAGKAAPGKYKIHGSKLTFLTGPYGKLHLHAVWSPQSKDQFGNVIGANISLQDAHYKPTGVSCYPH